MVKKLTKEVDYKKLNEADRMFLMQINHSNILHSMENIKWTTTIFNSFLVLVLAVFTFYTAYARQYWPWWLTVIIGIGLLIVVERTYKMTRIKTNLFKDIGKQSGKNYQKLFEIHFKNKFKK